MGFTAAGDVVTVAPSVAKGATAVVVSVITIAPIKTATAVVKIVAPARIKVTVAPRIEVTPAPRIEVAVKIAAPARIKVAPASTVEGTTEALWFTMIFEEVLTVPQCTGTEVLLGMILARGALVVDLVVRTMSAPVITVAVPSLARIGLARLHTGESGIVGVEAVCDGGELTEYAIKLRLQSRRIEGSARHVRRCARGGL
jgi:hypothetical protein